MSVLLTPSSRFLPLVFSCTAKAAGPGSTSYLLDVAVRTGKRREQGYSSNPRLIVLGNNNRYSQNWPSTWKKNGKKINGNTEAQKNGNVILRHSQACLTSAVSCGLGVFPTLLLSLQGNFLISIARRELSNLKTGR